MFELYSDSDRQRPPPLKMDFFFRIYFIWIVPYIHFKVVCICACMCVWLHYKTAQELIGIHIYTNVHLMHAACAMLERGGGRWWWWYIDMLWVVTTRAYARSIVQVAISSFNTFVTRGGSSSSHIKQLKLEFKFPHSENRSNGTARN